MSYISIYALFYKSFCFGFGAQCVGFLLYNSTFSTIQPSNRCGTLLNETANPRMWFNPYDTMTNTTGYRDRISANLQL